MSGKILIPALPLPALVSILPTYPEHLRVLQKKRSELGCLHPLAAADT